MITNIICSNFLTAGMFSFDDKLADPNHAYSGDEDALNDAEVNGNWTPQEKALHEARLKAKAKRRLRKSSSRNSTSESFSESGDVAGGDPNSPKGKVNTNDRKSRTGKGRGLPKKGMFGVCSFLLFFFFSFSESDWWFVCLCAGGAGGKGVWGAAGMVYEVEEPDVRDPNYDEAAQVSECSTPVWILSSS